MRRKNIFLPCRKRSEEDFVEEQVEEDKMDRESDSKGSIQVLRMNTLRMMTITSLQPLEMAFLSREVEGGVSIGSDNRDVSPSSSILPTSAHSDLPSVLHGYYKSKDGNVWCKNAPEPIKTPSRYIFRPPIRQIINPRNMNTAGAANER